MSEAPARHSTDCSCPEHPEYRLDFVPLGHRIRVVLNGHDVADSERVMVLHETRHEPVYYFPRDDVRTEWLSPSPLRTHCPFKGNAAHWTLTVGERSSADAAWSYDEPLEDTRYLLDHLAFYRDRVDAWYEGEDEVQRSYLPSEPAHGNPFVSWLLRDAWRLDGPADVVGGLGRCLVDAGVPVWRIFVLIRTLHPLLTGTAYNWWRREHGVGETMLPHDVLNSPRFLDSPLVPIFQGAGGIRRRLDVDEPRLDFPVLAELRSEGATDYVAMPMPFSDGQINVIALSSDRPGGFTTGHLGHLYEILGPVSRLLEVHAMRRTSATLLETYLGRHSGTRVLDGLVKRGDGENLHAVIWFCDLRESTPLADSMSREDFLGLLNSFFDCMAGAVLEHGGEVLRFIGDAALAIFLIPDADARAAACSNALAAACTARSRMAALNARRQRRDRRPLDYGIALHLGDVTYGNIGTSTRLEFTVVGAAANEAARIETLCKELDCPILVSAEFAASVKAPLVSVGEHCLRGLDTPRELFTLAGEGPR